MTSPAFSKTSIDSGMRAYDMHALEPLRCPQGVWYRSVTSNLKAINKPALINWAAKVNREAVFATIRDIYDDEGGRYSGDHFVRSVRDAADKPHHNIVSKGAADVGTLVHAYAEAVFSQRVMPPETVTSLATEANKREYLAAVHGFETWRKAHKVEPIWTERTLWLHPGEFHPTLGVCGTFDLAAVIDGETLLVDIKTSAEVYPEHWLQVETGLEAWYKRNAGYEPAHSAILTVGKNGTTKLTRCLDVGCKHAEWREAMQAAMTLANYLYGRAEE